MEISKPMGIGIAVATICVAGGLLWLALGRESNSGPNMGGGVPAQPTAAALPPDAGSQPGGAPPQGAAMPTAAIPR
jgi:hypothetical protein